MIFSGGDMSTRHYSGRRAGKWFRAVKRWARPPQVSSTVFPPRIGLALGGGFARGVAHAGVLRVFERYQIPLHCITGVSAGAIVAAAFASGTSASEIAKIGCSMRFADVARWSISWMGFAVSERMVAFLHRLLKRFRFEEMQLPLGVLATDLASGEAVSFRDQGDVCLPIRASCSYPGMFKPVRYGDKLLVDGAMSMEVPALLARQMGATHVVSVQLPMQSPAMAPQNMLAVVNRSFQILQAQTEESWRKLSDVVIVPDVREMEWDAFKCANQMVEAGEKAALEALPEIQRWLRGNASAKQERVAAIPLLTDSVPA